MIPVGFVRRCTSSRRRRNRGIKWIRRYRNTRSIRRRHKGDDFVCESRLESAARRRVHKRETSVTSDEEEAPHIMQSNFIAVMGATGHTGKKITETLLKAGQKVRALGRSESKLAELKGLGAEVFRGDTNDAAFLTKAFRGADAVYTLLPTDPRTPDFRAEQDRQGEAIVKAIRESGVRYVVALSSVGAELLKGGVIAGLHAQEERLKKIEGINLLLFGRSRSSRIFTARWR